MTTYKIKEMNSVDRKKFINSVSSKIENNLYEFPKFIMDGPVVYKFVITKKEEKYKLKKPKNG